MIFVEQENLSNNIVFNFGSRNIQIIENMTKLNKTCRIFDMISEIIQMKDIDERY